MTVFRAFALAFSISAALTGQLSRPGAFETVDIPSGNLHLRAFLWKPAGSGPFPAILFNHGSGGADAQHTAGYTMTEAAERLGQLFVERGYAFLYPCRRGYGLSADQGPYLQDLLLSEEKARGTEARNHLQFVLMTTDYLDDVMAALSYLKRVPGIDARRLGMAGHSFGGQLTLLAAERDTSLRAAISFAGAAGSWDRSSETRERLIAAVRGISAAVMLVQAANDYSTAPSIALRDELERLHKPHVVKIYPAVGQTADEGHNLLYLAVPRWQNDVFKFLDERLRR
jgi:dienelactone hydrolase